MDWSSTVQVLEEAAAAVRACRSLGAPQRHLPPWSGHQDTPFFEMGSIEATDNLRVSRIRPLLAAAVLIEEYKANAAIQHQVHPALATTPWMPIADAPPEA